MGCISMCKDSDLLLGDHMCEKFEAVNCVDRHDYNVFYYVMLMSSNYLFRGMEY